MIHLASRANPQPLGEPPTGDGVYQPGDSFYQPAAGCPEESWFVDQLHGNSSLTSELPAGVLATRVTATPEGYSGELVLTLSPQQADRLALVPSSWTRQIEGVRCDEVLLALSMALAVHLESLQADRAALSKRGDSNERGNGGESGTQRTTASEAGARARNGSGVTPGGKTNPQGAADASLEELERLMLWSDASEADSANSESDSARGWNWQPTVEAGASARSGLGARPGWSAQIAAALDGRGTMVEAGQYALAFTWSPATQLQPSKEDTAWSARWWTGSAEVCPLGVALLDSVKWMPCAALHIGSYELSLRSGERDAKWLGMGEMTSKLQARAGRWIGQLFVGAHAPLSPLEMLAHGETLYEQSIGAVVGANLGIAADF